MARPVRLAGQSRNALDAGRGKLCLHQQPRGRWPGKRRVPVPHPGPLLAAGVGSKAPGHSDSKRIVRGEFNYHGAVYRLAVTDPVIEIKYLSGEDGQYEIPQAVLCVSLGDPFQGYYYKLIASVLYGEPAQ